jgi:hypothetical protein
LAGSIISAVFVSESRQHHGSDLFRRVIGVKRSPRVGRAHQAVIVLCGQQHELASAAPSDLDRPSERSLDDLTGPVAEVGQGKMCHRYLLKQAKIAILMVFANLAIIRVAIKPKKERIETNSFIWRSPAITQSARDTP